MLMDFRVKVKVIFTVDVGVEENKIFAAEDAARMITENLFKQQFDRAHLLKIEATELMGLGTINESQ